MITGHKWRPEICKPHGPVIQWQDRPCAFCGRPRDEHRDSVKDPIWGNRKRPS